MGRDGYLGSVPEDDNAAWCEAQEVVDTVLALNTGTFNTAAAVKCTHGLIR